MMIALTYIPLDNINYDKEVSGILAWSCWAIPLLITDVILQAIKIKKSTTVTKLAANKNIAKSVAGRNKLQQQ
jgi:hypothetical protein